MGHKQMMLYADKRAAAFFCILDLLGYPAAAIGGEACVVVFVFIVVKAQHAHLFRKRNNKTNGAYFCDKGAYRLLGAEILIKFRQVTAFHNGHIVINTVAVKAARIFVTAPIMRGCYQINRLAFLKLIKLFAKFKVRNRFAVV